MKMKKALIGLGVAAAAIASAVTLGTRQDHSPHPFLEALPDLWVQKALAQSGESQLQSMRLFIWLVVGFPTQADYEAVFQTAEQKKTVGQSGLVGKISGLRDTVAAGILANVADIETCAEIPAVGEFEVGAGTMTFEAPANSAPDGWPTGGAYEKRVVYSETVDGVVETAAFEFFCDSPGMFALFSKATDADVTSRIALYYHREGEGALHFDFYLWEGASQFGSDGEISLAYMLRMEEEGKFETWVTRTGLKNFVNPLGYRYATHTNFASQETSFFTAAEIGTDEANSVTQAEWDAHADIGSTAVDGGVASSVATQTDAKNGCANDFDQPMSEITSAALCAGLDLSEAPTPALDDTGAMSLGWVQAHLKDKLLQLESP